MPDQHEKSEFVQGTLDMLILKTLSGGPLHGYAIASRPLATRPKPTADRVVAAQSSIGLQKLPRQQLFSAVREVYS